MSNIEGINIQQSSAERKSYVVVGAILSCSSGSQLSRLKMPFSHGVFVKGKPQVSIMDFVPNTNIMPFGKCSSLKNPAVASATAANNGVLTPMPCTPLTTMPLTTMPWMDGKADKMVDGHPALLNKSTNMCFHCGLIKIEDDGQDLGGVTVGNQAAAKSGSPAAGFGQGPACEKPQEKPSTWDHFVKGISKLGDVPAAMQKAASELPGALEKAANELPRGLQKAAEDLPKGVELFVQESFVEPMQEDMDTLQDDEINLADGLAIGGLALQALTLGRLKNLEEMLNATRKVKKGPVKAEPSKVVNALENFQSKKYIFGNQNFLIDKRGMKHILERHHPEYWDGSIKAKQTFLKEDMSIDEVANAIEFIMKENRDILLKNGTTFSYQIKGTYKDVEYIVGFNKGRVGQFYPEE